MALRDTTNQDLNSAVNSTDTKEELQCKPSIQTSDKQPATCVDMFSDYEDVTDRLRTGCSELELGEMIHVDAFTLLEGMSAIELSDKKPEEECRKVGESGMREDMSDGEVIAVLDQLFCCLATWLEGNTLVQTVFSFYHAVHTESIHNRLIQSFTRTLIKIMFSFKEAVRRAGVQEEEDAMDLSFNYSFLEDTRPNAMKGELAATMDWFSSDRKLSTSNLLADLEKRDLTREESLFLRLCLVQTLYSVVCNLDMFPDLSFMETTYSQINEAIRLLDFISKTRCHACEVTDWGVYGFETPDLTLLPPNPRRTSILPFKESAVCLRYSLEDVASIVCILRQDSFRAIYYATVSFSKDPIEKFRPNVLSRSYLKPMILYRSLLFGNFHFDVWLRDEIKSFCNPPSLNPASKMSAKPQTRNLVAQFLSRAQTTVVEVMQYLCLSRARQYQTLQHSLFQSLGLMLVDADAFDVQLHKIGEQVFPQESHTGYFVSWVLYHILQIMTDYLQLGFEYNLYSLFEYHYVFWYMEYLLGCRQSCGEMTQNLLKDRSEPVGKKGKGSGAKKRNKKDLEAKVYAFENEKIFLNILRLINIGYLRAIEGFKLAGKIMTPDFELGKKEYCYEQRFLPFSYLSTPTPLLYEKYFSNSDIEQLNPADRDKILQSSSKHFQVAKTGLDNIDVKSAEQEKILKVVKMNIVTMNLATSGHKMNDANPPGFDFSVSKLFPIIRL